MCLAIPAKITELKDGNLATVDILGVTRDIAVVCGAEIPVGDMVDHIMAEGGQYLKGCRIFDVYIGHHIAEGKKSVAFSLTMRADDQTLTDDHAEETVKKVLAALERKFGASIR